MSKEDEELSRRFNGDLESLIKYVDIIPNPFSSSPPRRTLSSISKFAKMHADRTAFQRILSAILSRKSDLVKIKGFRERLRHAQTFSAVCQNAVLFYF